MVLFVPGRICLFGEHSDWAGGYRKVNPDLEKGYTLICGIDQGIYADVRPHHQRLVLTSTDADGVTFGPAEIAMQPEILLAEAKGGGYWSYVAGVAYHALTRFGVRGLVLENDRTDLPVGKGLSSSAAICVLAARAFNRLYDLGLTTREEMELAYQGEITTSSRCGRMDQGCAFGKRPVLMTFDGDRLETEELVVEADLHLVIVDLMARKDTVKILADLNRCFPFAVNEIQRGVQELLGPLNKGIVRRAVNALRESDARRLGELMIEAQELFNRFAVPASPEELEAPMLHRLLKYEPLEPHVWGGKGIGSQGDGTAQFIARSAADQGAAIQMIERQFGMGCLAFTLSPPSSP
jgi:galactokinase